MPRGIRFLSIILAGASCAAPAWAQSQVPAQPQGGQTSAMAAAGQALPLIAMPNFNIDSICGRAGPAGSAAVKSCDLQQQQAQSDIQSVWPQMTLQDQQMAAMYSDYADMLPMVSQLYMREQMVAPLAPAAPPAPPAPIQPVFTQPGFGQSAYGQPPAGQMGLGQPGPGQLGYQPSYAQPAPAMTPPMPQSPTPAGAMQAAPAQPVAPPSILGQATPWAPAPSQPLNAPPDGNAMPAAAQPAAQ